MKRISALVLSLLLLGGCWDKYELEDSTFAVLMGLDAAPEGGLTVTLAFPLTQQQGGGVVEGMDNGSGSYAVVTATGPTLDAAMSLFSVQLAGPLSLHTIKTIVVSQALAQSDMLGQTLAAWRYEEIRNTASVVVSAGSAQDFIGARVTDALIDPLRQEELLLEQANKSAYYSPMKLLELLVALQSDSGDGVAIYGGALPPHEAEKPAQETAAVEAGHLPQSAPVTGDNRSRIWGLAVFHGGRMVGALDAQEAQTYSLLTGAATPVLITLPDPLNPDALLTVRLVPQGRPAIHSRVEADGAASFTLALRLTCMVSGGGQQDASLLEAALETLCLERMEALMGKVQADYEADILRLGDKLAHHFITDRDWADYAWPSQYPRAQITVQVQVDVQHTGVARP